MIVKLIGERRTVEEFQSLLKKMVFVKSSVSRDNTTVPGYPYLLKVIRSVEEVSARLHRRHEWHQD